MEWQYSSKPPRWTLRVGPWQAVVEPLPQPGGHWAPRVEHVTEAQRRTDGPLFDDPTQAQAWCLNTIAELRTQVNGPQQQSPEHDPEGR